MPAFCIFAVQGSITLNPMHENMAISASLSHTANFAPCGMDKIAILDFGSQFAHLLANRVRRLNVYSEMLDAETPAEKLKG